MSGSDPDGDAVNYYYKVCLNPDAETNCVWEAGWLNESRVTVPPGRLNWNTTYYWHVYVGDFQVGTAPSWVWSFTPSNAAPPTPAPRQPANGATSATPTPTLTADAVADPDHDGVQYLFRLVTGDDAVTGGVVESGWRNEAQWTVPPGVLRDREDYTWSVTSRDTIGAQSAPSGPVSFSVDVGAGSRPAIAYDALGPVSVNLTTGNVSASVSSPAVATVGGPLGLSYT